MSHARQWRNLQELAQGVDEETLLREFPALAAADPDGVSRRGFLKLLGASLSLAGLTGCDRGQPPEQIVPYVNPPENLVPGKPLRYATAMPRAGYGYGVVAEQYDGRPTKIEGNPDHPAVLGASDAVMQASVLDLYDPDRSAQVKCRGNPSTVGQLMQAIQRKMADAGGAGRVRIALLCGATSSPTWERLIGEMRRVFPGFRLFGHDLMAPVNAWAGSERAYGRRLDVVYDLGAARRIVSLDSDFLTDLPGSVRYQREFASGRRVTKERIPTAETMSRLYVAESTTTITGAKADERVAVQTRMIPLLARALAQGITGGGGDDAPGAARAWVRNAVADLRAAGAEGVVIVGPQQPAEIHALAHAMNQKLRSRAVRMIEVVPAVWAGAETINKLMDALASKQIDLLLISDCNPVYTEPRFAEALKTGDAMVVHHGLYANETAALATWHVPALHYLESWGDVRGHDGTVSVIQPLIGRLYASVGLHELLASVAAMGAGGSPAIADQTNAGKDLVGATWRERGYAPFGLGIESRAWNEALRRGVVDGTASVPVAAELRGSLDQFAEQVVAKAGAETIELNLRLDPFLGDGRYANNSWLMELPRPLTKLTWGNAAIISPGMAVKMGLAASGELWAADGRMVEIQVDGKRLALPVWVQPGQPDGVVTVHWGYGRTAAGRVGDGVGVSAYGLNPQGKMKLAVLEKTVAMVSTQSHHLMQGRDLVRSVGVSELERRIADQEAREKKEKRVPLSLYREYPYKGYKWGMEIDLNACTGCSACVAACQAENNIPSVGKEAVLRGREMHWLRIDTYYESADALASDAAQPMFQPMLCQHCENAPCEVVCPVEATTHSSEGLNEMTYNRCVGTRYCSNNCPYKVRRFNFFDYNAGTNDETLKMVHNPEVTVRSRGVMEKCTYCVQRINQSRMDVEKARVMQEAQGKSVEMREPAEGAEALPRISMMTACQQACPAEAIVFGDLNDKGSRLYQLRNREPFKQLSYGVLTELTTQPRTEYLPVLKNPAEGAGGAA